MEVLVLGCGFYHHDLVRFGLVGFLPVFEGTRAERIDC